MVLKAGRLEQVHQYPNPTPLETGSHNQGAFYVGTSGCDPNKRNIIVPSLPGHFRGVLSGLICLLSNILCVNQYLALLYRLLRLEMIQRSVVLQDLGERVIYHLTTSFN